MTDAAETPSPAAARRPKLIYLVTEDWYFWSHRLPMAEAALAAGFDVAVACRVRDHGDRIQAKGFTVYPLGWRRDRLGLVPTLRDVIEITRLYRRKQPTIVHHVALKPAVLGSLAATLAGIPNVVNALTGLGYLFISKSLKARAFRLPVMIALRWLLNRGNSRVIVQNQNDRDFLEQIGLLEPQRAVTIRGSGIDVERFKPLLEPVDTPMTIAYVGRMIEDKGVRVVVDAVRKLNGRSSAVKLVLAGQPDAENPGSISESELREWSADPAIAWIGPVEDVRTVWACSHVAVLMSHREGLPKSLLEAAACGRPIIATDVPGCREIARAGENALLVPPNDPEALAAAIETLCRDPGLRNRFSLASRRIVETELSAQRVGEAVVALYAEMLDRRCFTQKSYNSSSRSRAG